MERWLIFTCILVGILLAGLTTYVLLPEKCEGPITCSSDAQCGGTIVGEKFCRDSNVWGNGQVNVCRNAGSCDAVCETAYQTILVEECENGCSNGACI